MKILLLLASLTIAKAGVIKEASEESPCDGVVINGVYHEKEIIKEDLDRPYMLAVDNKSNILYFSYSVQKHDDVFRTAKIDLKNNEFKDLDIVNGFAQSVDQKTQDVYIGSNEGIYKYDSINDQSEFIGQRGSDIWAIYFNEVLYYSEFPSQFLYTLINGTVERFKDLEDTKVDHFIIDKDNVMFYTNVTGLYSQKKGTKEAVLFEEFPQIGLRGIAMDGVGDIFVCLRDGIYKADKKEAVLRKAIEVDDCFGLAFGKDNHIIYADFRSVVRLKPNEKKSC